RQRAGASVVPGAGQALELDEPGLGAPAARPRVVLPADLVDRAAHDLADRPDRLQPREREVADRQPRREGAATGRERGQALLGGERDAAARDALHVLLAALARGSVVALVVAALEEVEEAHGRSADQALERRARLG